MVSFCFQIHPPPPSLHFTIRKDCAESGDPPGGCILLQESDLFPDRLIPLDAQSRQETNQSASSSATSSGMDGQEFGMELATVVNDVKVGPGCLWKPLMSNIASLSEVA